MVSPVLAPRMYSSQIYRLSRCVVTFFVMESPEVRAEDLLGDLVSSTEGQEFEYPVSEELEVPRAGTNI